MNSTHKQHQAHSRFAWAMRRLLLDLAAMSVAVAAALLAGTLTHYFFIAIPGVYSMIGQAIGDPGVQPVAMSGAVYWVFFFFGLLVSAVVLYQVFTLVFRLARNALDRYELLPPPLTAVR